MENNAYQRARQEWDERYADLVHGKRNWQIAAAGSIAVSLILAFGIVWLSTRSRFVPYVVEVDKLGFALAAPQALSAESPSHVTDERMLRYELAGFIRSAREVIADQAAEHQAMQQVYSRSRGAAYALLEAYYHQNNLEHDPFKVAEHQTVTVQIDSILSLSKSSWQVRWTEQALDLQGSPIGTSHWEAMLETRTVPPTSDESILDNPLGLYVTRLSWTRQ